MRSRRLALVLAAALLSFPTVVAAPANLEATATLVCRDILLAGGALQSANTSSIEIPRTGGDFSWTFESEKVVVNWTRVTVVEVMNPADPSKVLSRVDAGQAQGERRFNQSSGNSSSSNQHSEARFLAAQGGVFLSSISSEVKLFPAKLTGRTGDPGPPDLNAPPIDGQIEGNFTQGSSLIRGNFTAFIWGANVTVRDSAGEHYFRSGNWTEAIDPASQGSSYLRYHYFQWLRVTFGASDLRLSVNQREAHFTAGRLWYDGTTNASFVDAVGFALFDGKRKELAPGRLTLSGELSFMARNETGRLAVDLRAAPGVLGFQLASPVSAEGTNQQLATPTQTESSLWLRIAFLSAALAGAVFLANRHVREVRIDDVEWALFNQRPRRARRLAKRLLRKRPSNVDALFLYGTSLLVLQDFRGIMKQVEPRALRLPAGKRLGVSYLLAVSARRVGDSGRERRWANEAARDKALRGELIRDGLWNPGQAVLGAQTGYA